MIVIFLVLGTETAKNLMNRVANALSVGDAFLTRIFHQG